MTGGLSRGLRPSVSWAECDRTWSHAGPDGLGEQTGERSLAGVHADVVDQFVLGLERLALAVAVAPIARVVRLLRSADVVDRQVGDELHDGREQPTALGQ